MYRNKKITVIIPCYNEETAIESVIKEVPRYVDEILIIDSSTDRTAEIAKQLGTRVVREERRGYGRAYKTGFQEAQGDIITTMDGDCTYPTDEIARLIDFLLDNNLDFVSGCRFPLKQKGAMKWANILGNRGVTLVAMVLFQRRIKDLLSGMWILRKEIIPQLNLISDNWNFSEEIKLEVALRRDLRFAEFHISYRPRLGKTKIPGLAAAKTGLENTIFLLKKRFNLIESI